MSKILFVEDEIFLMESYIEELRDLGHEVVLARDGEAAMGYLQQDHHGFDLVILDLMLPRGRSTGTGTIKKQVSKVEMGLYVIKQVRTVFGDTTPIIVHSAVADDATKAKVKEYGVDDFLVKPMSLTLFLTAVTKALPSTS